MAGIIWQDGRHIISDARMSVDTGFAMSIASPVNNCENDSKRLNRKTVYEETETGAALWEEDSSIIDEELKSRTDRDIQAAGKNYKAYWHVTNQDPLNYALMVVWDASYTPPEQWWNN